MPCVAVSAAIATVLAFGGPAFAKPVPADDKPLVDRILLWAGALFPPRVYLVKLEVVDVGVEIPVDSFRVLHVYAGPRRLKDARFVTPRVFGREGLASGNPFLPRGQMRRGDIGLFVVTETSDSREISVLGPREAREFNVTPVINEYKHFRRFIELAEVVQQIYQANDEKRLRKIDDLLRCGDVAKACTAFWYLKQAKDPELIPYFLGLSRDNALPIEVQLDLYDVLRARDKGWAGSRGELEMVARWFTEPWKGISEPRDDWWHNPPKLSYLCSNEEEALNSWLMSATAEKHYSVARLLDLAVKGLANPKRSEKFKQQVLDVFDGIGHDLTRERKERDKGFSYLLGQIKHGACVAEKAAAAKLLAKFSPLSAGQDKELRALLAGIREVSVAEQLRSILEEK